MVEKALTSRPLLESRRTSDSIDTKLKRFQACQYRPLRWILCRLPWVILLFMGLIFFEKPFFPMYASMYLASSLGILAFQYLMKLIPETLYSLWNRNIIATKYAREDLTSIYCLLNCIKKIIKKIILIRNKNGEDVNIPVEVQYRTFIQEFEDRLNNPWGQRIFGFIFAAILWGGGYNYKFGISNFILNFGNLDILTLSHYVLELLTSFVFGLMAWRMTIIGVEVILLVERFDLTPRLGHPDRCGGLSPLGNLCLWNAIIIGIMGIFLAGWIIIVQISSTAAEQYGNSYILLQSILLIVPIFFGLISFFLPLWFVHDIMVAKFAKILQRLDQLGKTIHQIEVEILYTVDKVEMSESEKMLKKLELMRQTYQENLQYATWPFNTVILKKFLLSITGPVLALLLSVVNAIGDIHTIAAFLSSK